MNSPIAFLASEMEQLRRDRDALRASAWGPDGQAELDRLVEDLEAQRLRVGRAAVLTLVGSTGAGKSTLLNALVGRSVAQAGEARPTTRVPVIYAPEDADVSEWLKDLPGKAPQVVRYETQAQGSTAGGVWSGQILIDAPDTNSVATGHREVVRALAEKSDVLVALAHRQSVVEESTVQFLEEFAQMRGLVLAIGHGDRLAERGRDELAEQFAKLARERFGWRGQQVHVLSPLEQINTGESPGWKAFCSELFAHAEAGQLVRVRRYNALGSARRIAQLSVSQRPQLERDWSALEALVGEAKAALSGQVTGEIARRLDLRTKDLEALLWEETGRRWNGPGGMALRVGGLASLGLGAGAWLARRNPLLAAGAAAGAFVTSKVQRHNRDKEVRGGGAWLMVSADWRRAFEASFAPVRLAIKQVETHGAHPTHEDDWPRADELEEQLEVAVSEGIEKFMDADLQEQAQAAARSPLRWIVDGPIFVFGAWILYRSAIGFYQGEYVGMDFLVNAALLALAWLWLARTGLRRWLRGRVVRLTAGVQARLNERISAVFEESLGVMVQAVQGKREALTRLCRLEEHWRARLEEKSPPQS